MVLTGMEPTLPIWLESEYSLSKTNIGLVFLAFVIPSIFISPIAGWAYDQYGLKIVMFVGLIISAPISVAIGIGHRSLAWSCVEFFILGCGLATVSVPLLPEISKKVPQSAYTKAYSIFNIAWSLGLFLGVCFLSSSSSSSSSSSLTSFCPN